MYYPLMVVIILACFNANLIAMDWRDIVHENIKQVKAGDKPKAILDQPLEFASSPLCIATQLDYQLMADLLAAGADPNVGFPLRYAHTQEAVEKLLAAGADAKRCNGGQPFYGFFSRYCAFKKTQRNNNLSGSDSLLNKMLASAQRLIDARADINQQWHNEHPIMAIIANKEIESAEKKVIISFLLLNGCDIQLRKDKWSKQSVIDYYRKNDTNEKSKREWYTFLKHETYLVRYLSVRQLLIAYYKEPTSRIARLPKELMHIIGNMVMQHELWKF